jgi:hypothetical protein
MEAGVDLNPRLSFSPLKINRSGTMTNGYYKAKKDLAKSKILNTRGSDS